MHPGHTHPTKDSAFLGKQMWAMLACLAVLFAVHAAEAAQIDKAQTSEGGAKHAPRDDLSKPFPPEEPQPLPKLQRELAALDALVQRTEAKDQYFAQKLIAPTILFSAGCATSIIGIVLMSVFPSMAGNGLLFGTPLTWLVMGIITAVVGFGLIIGGGVWHGPIHKKRIPTAENLKELRFRRNHLRDLIQRRVQRRSATQSHGVLALPQSARGTIGWYF